MAPRSKWKGPFVAEAVKAITNGAKIYSRGSTILTDFVGLLVHVHNGKAFLPVKITEDMVGHKFGEFAATRKLRSLRNTAANAGGKGKGGGGGGGGAAPQGKPGGKKK